MDMVVRKNVFKRRTFILYHFLSIVNKEKVTEVIKSEQDFSSSEIL